MLMNMDSAFAPQGNTIALAAANSAPATSSQVLVTGTNPEQGVSIRIYNPGTAPVFVGFGASSAVAIANAVIPIVGTSSLAVPVQPGAESVMNFPKGSYFAVISSVATTVYLTPGIGKK